MTPVRDPSPFELRREIIRLTMNELLGPAGGPEEEVAESVRDRYLLGMLAPRKQAVFREIQPDRPVHSRVL